ncbi:MAG: ATP-binding protein [Gemmatimonadaceae bacterium]
MTTPPDGTKKSPTITGEFARHWIQFTSGLTTLEERLTREVQDEWRAVTALLAAQRAAATRSIEGVEALTPQSYIAARDAASRAVLLKPLDSRDRRDPLESAQRAVRNYHQGLDDLVRRLPESVDVTGATVLDVLGDGEGAGLARRIASWRKKESPLALRAVLAGALLDIESGQRGAEGDCFVAIARGMQEVRQQWDHVRERVDMQLADAALDDIAPGDGSADVVPGLQSDVTQALAQLDESFGRMRVVAGRDLLRAAAWGRVRTLDGAHRARTRHLEHWGTQAASLRTELQLERTEDAVERELLRVVDQTMVSLEAERQRLLSEIDVYLQVFGATTSAAEAARALPDANGIVVPAQSRSRDLAHTVSEVLTALPESVSLIERFTPRAKRHIARHTTAPRRLAGEAYAYFGKVRFQTTFEDVQHSHVGLVQQIERARQVVEFAAERGDGATDESAAREALTNARELLTGIRTETPDHLDAPRQALLAAVADVLIENRILLKRGRFGQLARIGGFGARRGVLAAATATVAVLLSGARSLFSGTKELIRRFLVAIEWIPPADADKPSVIRRPYLPREFTVDPHEQELPAIYRRLFRFDAVTDARFLVGRDREMQAFGEARTLWEAGRPVAIVVVGERGSGKTSLINCALASPLADLPVLRGEFNERLSTAGEVRQYMAKLVGVKDPAEVEAHLLAERRVVVLEETERTFLRDIGGFDGIRHLQRLIAATSSTTLWVVVTNQHAFRFLNAAARFGDTFSHRMDAASASAEAVHESILVRHNLSGLRLRFEPAPSDGSMRGRIRRWLRGAGDPEQDFFAGLARESGGVFRSAFQLWLGQVDQVQAGILTMKPVRRPDIDAVIAELDSDDLFTLVAVMQHGSVTADEHARVFHCPRQSSQAQMDELLARELIEEDPGRTGYRVRPRAMRVVGEALRRRNLG